MIEVKNLHKRFGKSVSVDGVSLAIGKGQIFGLLGPNAAGKTTTIRMICGILEPDEGEVLIGGKAVDKAKEHFGYVAQYEELSVWENLEFYAQMYGIDNQRRLMFLLERYDLLRFKDHAAGTLSGGTQRRLALACALAHDPSVLFLDEPTAGIDPVTRKKLWDEFYRLASEGKTLFVTTHYMEEAERCDLLAFMSAGKIVVQGTPQSIKENLGDYRVYSAKVAYDATLHVHLQAMEGMVLLSQFGSELRAVVSAPLDALTLGEESGKVEWKQDKANLEDMFIALTQGGVK